MIILAIILCIVKHLFSQYEYSQPLCVLSALLVHFHPFLLSLLTGVIAREHVGDLHFVAESAMLLLPEI